MNIQTRSFRNILSAAALAAAAFVALPASAEIKREGTWPEEDKPVSVDVSGVSRADAVRKLADAAGWSLVTDGVGSTPVDLHIKDQSPAAVLELLLDDGKYVATRTGTLVRIQRATAEAPATPPAVPAVPAVPAAKADEETKDAKPAKANRRGEDRTIFGSNARIEENEVVDDVTVFGGNVEVLGRVTGDLSVFGGNVYVKETGRIDGDASLMGGNLELKSGASVGKDVSIMGGSLYRAEGAVVGGEVVNKKDDGVGFHFGTDPLPQQGFIGRLGSRLTAMAILFVFGTILLALGAARMETMRIEIAARPMRTMALGVVSFFGAILAAVVLCVTIIGIPIAAVGVLLAVFAGYAGATAALTTVGAAVLQHRTQSPYAHLAFGCAALFVIGMIPVIGTFVTLFVGALGLGVIVATRGAGFLAKRRNGGTPYRTAHEEIV